ncbi:MAG: hypothetical protein PHT58_06360 [Eubacteriales bacterium]|nr:hypothetical protein [Eubacteriales bacterium]
MKYCKKCGVLYSTDVCPKCGIIYPNEDEQKPVVASKDKIKHQWIALVIGIPALIAALYLVIYFIYK